MITLQLEVVGDCVAIVLDETARAALNIQVGDHVHLRRTPEGEIALERAGADYEDRHERSRAFLKRFACADGLARLLEGRLAGAPQSQQTLSRRRDRPR